MTFHRDSLGIVFVCLICDGSKCQICVNTLIRQGTYFMGKSSTWERQKNKILVKGLITDLPVVMDEDMVLEGDRRSDHEGDKFPISMS